MKLSIKPIDESKIYYLLLMLGCMNFMEQGALLFLMLGCYGIIRYPILEKSLNIIVIGILVATICIVSFAWGSAFSEMVKAWNYILWYLIGRNGFTYAKNKEKFVKGTLLYVFLGFFIQLSLIYVYNFNRDVILGQRLMYSIWTGEYIAVTLIGLLSAVLIGYSFYGVIVCKNKWIKAISIFSIILTIAVNFSSATRTPIFLMVIIWTIMSCFYFAKIDRAQKIKIIFGTSLIGIVTFIIYSLDAFGLKRYIQSSALYTRLYNEGMETSRWDIMWDYWELMPHHLMGGSNIKSEVGIEAHNYLQQAYDMYGVVAFIMMILITIHFMRNVIILVGRIKDLECIILVLGVFTALFIQCCCEPVLTGYPICFWLLMLIDGIMSAFNAHSSTLTQEDEYEDCSNQYL